MPNAKPHASKEAHLIVILCSLLLYVGCAGSGLNPPSNSPLSVSAIPFEKSVNFDLSSASSIDPRTTLTISNQGNNPIVMPVLVLKGNSALNRSSVLYPMQGLKDEELALATWKFDVEHGQHFCNAGTPADLNEFTTEPMRLLNGFGMMCCDQRGFVLAWLWQGAGYKSRVVWMDFHEVPEIYYAGAWHMFDPDHNVYYLQLDNKTVASVADLIANPYLVLRVADANGLDPGGSPAQQMANSYAAAVPKYLTIDYRVQQTWFLQPSQSVSFDYAQSIPVFHGSAVEPSIPPASTGTFDWSIDYSNPNWGSLTHAVSGVTTFGDGSSVFLANSQKTGFAVYALSSPFPVISLQVGGLVNLMSPNAAVKAYFSTDGISWSPPFPLTSTGSVPAQMSADLSSVAAGQYTYFVKLEMSGDSPQSANIANVHLISQFQDSMFIFPNLIPGQINHLTYQDWSPATAEHQVKISLNNLNSQN